MKLQECAKARGLVTSRIFVVIDMEAYEQEEERQVVSEVDLGFKNGLYVPENGSNYSFGNWCMFESPRWQLDCPDPR
jgi:hypothetical protein